MEAICLHFGISAAHASNAAGALRGRAAVSSPGSYPGGRGCESRPRYRLSVGEIGRSGAEPTWVGWIAANPPGCRPGATG